jgi:hypothetical protein
MNGQEYCFLSISDSLLLFTMGIPNSLDNKLGAMLVTANIVHSSLILYTLMTETIHSSETSVLTRATSQKTALFRVTAGKTSNLMTYIFVCLRGPHY